MKGAPEKILELCSTISIKNGKEPLTGAHRTRIDDILTRLGKKGERVLGENFKDQSSPAVFCQHWQFSFSFRWPSNINIGVILIVGDDVVIIEGKDLRKSYDNVKSS